MIRCWPIALWAALLLVSSAHAQNRISRAIPSEEGLRRYGMVRHWYAIAPIDGVREQVRTVTLADDQLHIQTNASRIHALGAETGQLLWSTQIGRPLPTHFGSAINSDSVFAISTTRLYRVSRDDGTLLWSLPLRGVPNAAPAADDTHVLVSTIDGRMYVYDATTRDLVWYYQTNAAVSIPGLLIDDKVVCASEDGLLYVFPMSNPQRIPIFRYPTGGPISAMLASWGRLLLVPSQDTQLYAVDVRSGQTQWRYSATAEIRRPVTVVENEVFLTPEGAGLHVINAETGDRIWLYPHASDFVAASAKRVYAADKSRRLLIQDRQNGRVLHVWDSHEFDFRLRNQVNDRIYLVTRTGLVVCLREREHPTPLVHQKMLPADLDEAAAQAPGAAL